MSGEDFPPAFIPRKSLPGIAWPRVTGGRDAVLLGLLFQFEQMQWAAPEQLRAFQMRQLHTLLTHCQRSVPHYREKLRAAGFAPERPLTDEVWRNIPLLSREDILDAGAALRSSQVPKSHGRHHDRSSSGSTGKPVKVLTTSLSGLFWDACNQRDHIWQRRNVRGKFAVMRGRDPTAGYPAGLRKESWGASAFASGPAVLLRIDSTIEQQAEWLSRENPDYLQTAPHNLYALLQYCRANGIGPANLRGVSSYGGMLHPQERRACHDVWGVPVADIYSAEEVGYMALQCPDHEHLHVQSETILLEILDDEGRPCAAGEQGRVVVTPLHEFAQPLVRYEIGDFAEAGGPCPCGRGLPVIARIVGRERNMLTLPSGQRVAPAFINDLVADLPVTQFQIAQPAPDRLEARIVARGAFGTAEEARLLERLHARLPAAYQISFSYHDEIPRSRSGKYMDFKSELDR